MKKEKETPGAQKTINALIAIIGVMFIGMIVYFDSDATNPRAKNGMDTIMANDSVYYISFRIDSVLKNEPQE